MHSITRRVVTLLLVFGSFSAGAETKVLQADVRPRPPYMVVNEITGEFSGPMLEVFNEAAKTLGYSVQWQLNPLPRTLLRLKRGDTDIAPRLLVTDERKIFIEFLGPYAVSNTPFKFLVKCGKEHSLKSYADLKTLTVGVKRETAWFKQFQEDQSIRKVAGLDDDNMALMFAAGRFDTMIVYDQAAIEAALRKHNISGYAWADYQEPVTMPLYYAMSKASKHRAIAQPLSAALREMASSGRVAQIYKMFGVLVPE